MNERIKQLVLQSQLVYETTDGKVYNSWEDYVDLTEYVEKFAELIIEECLRMCDCAEASLLEHSYPRESDGAASVKIFIKEHFGVKE